MSDLSHAFENALLDKTSPGVGSLLVVVDYS